ncbi:cbb3-type cytochrome oxidase assembly protein CcoS [Luteimonas changyuni]|uniref:cbb3-type cytochrome oxidase assembly protein CcoS n=1 Tax=Luteimonas sp. MJ145 TaxID=3129234 RepID=UPI0031BA6CCE
MNVLLFLIPVSIVLLGIAVWAFRWAVRKGQFENLDAAAIDILRDDSTDQLPPATRNAVVVDDAATGATGATDRAGTDAFGDVGAARERSDNHAD